LNLPGILRIFYRTQLKYLPVVESDAEGRTHLIGFLLRDLLDREMSDLNRAEQEFDRIPEHLYQLDSLPEELYRIFSGRGAIPVFDTRANELSPPWNESDFLRALADFRDRVESTKLPSPSAAPTPEPAEPLDSSEWLARSILAGLPFALFVSDLKGNTLFYNELFERQILNRPVFKKKIGIVEAYLLELSRDLLAASAAAGESTERLSAFLSEMDLFVQITSLENGGRLLGYLYRFHDQEELYTDLARSLIQPKAMTPFLEEIESRIIYRVLKANGFNISHTAEALGFRRSTLQSRIKLLKMQERFDMHVDHPIHRKRTPERTSVGKKPPVRKKGSGKGAGRAVTKSAKKKGETKRPVGSVKKKSSGGKQRPERKKTPKPKRSSGKPGHR